jgi:hypothetical protein
LGYIEAFVGKIRIDGAFGDWQKVGTQFDQADDTSEDIDIRETKNAIDSDNLFFYLNVNGELLSGSNIPIDISKFIPTPQPSHEPTEPTGPGPTSDSKDILVLSRSAGEDRIEIEITAERLISSLSPLKYQVIITGSNGEISTARVLQFDNNRWQDLNTNTPGLQHAKDYDELELSLPRSLFKTVKSILGSVIVHSWTGQSDQGLFKSLIHTVDFTRSVDEDEYENIRGNRGSGYSLKTEGLVFFSADMLAWNYKGNPEIGARFVDIATGTETTAGYIYLLRNDGVVYFTDRGTNGWNQYGYGLPSAPINTSYVGITAGSGNTAGYIYIMRSDGKVYFTDRGTNGWYQYGYGAPTLPPGTSYVSISSGADNTVGYIYILRNDGRVFFTDRGVNGWYQYGYGTPNIEESNAYVGLTVGSGTTAGYVYVLRNDGHVFFTDRGVNGWYPYGYGTPTIPISYSYVDITSGSDTTAGYVYVLRNDGVLYFTDRGVNGWNQYGYGNPAIPTSTSYLGVVSGSRSVSGYTMILRNDGTIYFTDRGVNGWNEYGYGSPPISANMSFISIAAHQPVDSVWVLREDGRVYKSEDNGAIWSTFGDAGTDRSWVSLTVSLSYIYALRNDGTVMRSGLATASWTSWGDSGTDTSWVGIAVDDNNYLYTLRCDGAVSYATESSNTWTTKGDAGSDSSWVDLASLDGSGSGYVYAMRNNRSIARSLAGSGTTWTAWASAGEDTAWVAITTNSTHVFALRNDGRIDRADTSASPTWNAPFTDAGTDHSFVDIAIAIAEYELVMIPILLLLFYIVGIHGKNKKNREKK